VSLIASLIAAPLLIAGSLFLMIGGYGVMRLPDFYARVHAAGVIDTLGMAFILLGLMVLGGLTLVTVKLFLIIILLLVTGPTACHALARAALHDNHPAADSIEEVDLRGGEPSKR
jgi:multicomponent Na+:H+ antiporter subunit G